MLSTHTIRDDTTSFSRGHHRQVKNMIGAPLCNDGLQHKGFLVPAPAKGNAAPERSSAQGESEREERSEQPAGEGTQGEHRTQRSSISSSDTRRPQRWRGNRCSGAVASIGQRDGSTLQKCGTPMKERVHSEPRVLSKGLGGSGTGLTAERGDERGDERGGRRTDREDNREEMGAAS